MITIRDIFRLHWATWKASKELCSCQFVRGGFTADQGTGWELGSDPTPLRKIATQWSCKREKEKELISHTFPLNWKQGKQCFWSLHCKKRRGDRAGFSPTPTPTPEPARDSCTICKSLQLKRLAFSDPISWTGTEAYFWASQCNREVRNNTFLSFSL